MELELLTDDALAKRLAVSRATVWRWVRIGRLPAPIRIGERTTRWRASDVAEYIAACRPHKASA